MGMRQGVRDIVNARLAADTGTDYQLAARPDGGHLLLCDAEDRTVVSTKCI